MVEHEPRNGNVAVLITACAKMLSRPGKLRMKNNFNLIRLILSLSVLFSHSPPMNGTPRTALEYYLFEPWGMAFGSFAVAMFFVLSGYLITQSYNRTENFLVFSAHRILRLAPALVIAVPLSLWMFARYNHYAGNPIPLANGSLWTIGWEVTCYVACALLGTAGILTKRNFNIFFAVAWLVYFSHIGDASFFSKKVEPPLMFFLMGSFIATNEGELNIKRAGLVSAFVLAAAFLQPVNFAILNVFHQIPTLGDAIADWRIQMIAFIASAPFVLIYLGKHARALPFIRHDISYGVYIYSWPVQEIVIYEARKHGFSLTGSEVFAAALIPVLALAIASCRLVEEPMLRLKDLLPSARHRAQLDQEPTGAA